MLACGEPVEALRQSVNIYLKLTDYAMSRVEVQLSDSFVEVRTRGRKAP